MKFVCLGYADLNKMKEYSQEEMSALMERCFVYDDELRRGGHGPQLVGIGYPTMDLSSRGCRRGRSRWSRRPTRVRREPLPASARLMRPILGPGSGTLPPLLSSTRPDLRRP